MSSVLTQLVAELNAGTLRIVDLTQHSARPPP